MKKTIWLPMYFIFVITLLQCNSSNEIIIQSPLSISQNDRIVLIGNNLCSRMMNYGFFETEMHLRFPNDKLFIRNMCDPGNTPGFRPHSGRNNPWAFPGAERFQTELANPSQSEGHFETPDEWLHRLKPNKILAFFGYNESFQSGSGLENFKKELDTFIQHTLSQKYNGKNSPQLVLISPIAFQNLTDQNSLPDGKIENVNILLYKNAMQEIADKNNVLFLDAFLTTQKWFSKEQLTIDGSQLNEKGYKKFANFLIENIFEKKSQSNSDFKLVHEAVQEKNWFWKNDFKIPNGVHVFGRRYKPFGPDNYPEEIAKIREMTSIRDEAIWKAVKGEKMNIAKADKKTRSLPDVTSNYTLPDNEDEPKYLYGEDAINSFELPEGYKIELFASEKEFPDLANPVQMSFDNKGRLWVAVMPSYPHYKPGDKKPNDKLLIFEDTDSDGKADRQIVFADQLHLPLGFELAADGVYLAQGIDLVFLSDTDGDDKADTKEILLSGFDDHDSHHGASAFCADPGGGIFMGEGVFLHTNIETSYGTVRATNGGFYRYSPKLHQLERTAQLPIPNPWGIAFDEWGQNFYLETSSTVLSWMMPGSVKPIYGISTSKSPNLINEKHRVRPTSGLEFVSSRHFPEEVQNDILLNNTIGFLGTKQHSISDDGTGYKTNFRQDLVKSSDGNYRPVDLEFAPDGTLFIVDWHNILIGHMQHNARDPYRDHAHGRIYRIIYPSRPLVTPAKIANESVKALLENLKLPEYRTRYRTRRELRGRSTDEVSKELKRWVKNLDKTDVDYDHHLLEALWVSWGMNKIDVNILLGNLKSKNYKVRAAAVKVLRYAGHQIENQKKLLMDAAKDEHGRVRMEAFVAASWLKKEDGIPIVLEAEKKPIDDWMVAAYQASLAHLNGKGVKQVKEEKLVENDLKGNDLSMYLIGKEIYQKEGYCSTCHQADGKGLEASGFPPIANTEWINGDKNRLIKLTLKGMIGELTLDGKKYSGQVPMTPFEGLLDDVEVAAVLTFVRNSFGNKSSVISAEEVKLVRDQVKNKKGFFSTEELLKEHPLLQ